MVISLGRLESVLVRDIWGDEARDFTPWLAEVENLSFLGDALGLPLELEATERSVGPFSADILAKDISRDSWVVIENQLESTDHRHLGQLLTYAAGLGAKTVVWVAPDFREEHRAAIDWLNQATASGYDFFGVQVEVFRIGESAAAPRFTVVAKPNDWARSVASGKRRIQDDEPTESQRKWIDYWSGLVQVVGQQIPQIAGRSAAKGNWQPVIRLRGAPEATFDVLATSPKGRLRLELYLDLRLAKAAFRKLEENREDLERELGEQLSWELLPEARASRVALYMTGESGADPLRKAAQYSWFSKVAPRFVDVMKAAVSRIDLDALATDEEIAAG